MTRKARALAAIRREPVDRVPHATYNLHPYGANAHSKDPSYAPLLEKVRADACAFIKAGIGGIEVGLTRRREGLKETRTEGAGDARTVTAILHTPKGDLTRVKRAPENKPDMITKPFIASDADIERYMSIPYEPPQFDLASAHAIQQAAGDAAIVGIMFPDAMDSVSELFDFEDFCFRCVTDLPSVLRFMDWASERCEANMKLLLEAVRDSVPGERRTDLVLHTCGPEICTPPMMPPALFARLVTPYLRRLIRLAHDGGMLDGPPLPRARARGLPGNSPHRRGLARADRAAGPGGYYARRTHAPGAGPHLPHGPHPGPGVLLGAAGVHDQARRGDRQSRARPHRLHHVPDLHAVPVPLFRDLPAQLP